MTIRPKMQIDISEKTKNRAKAVAIESGMTLSELVLIGLSKVGDEKLAKLVKEELENRGKRGRPSSN